MQSHLFASIIKSNIDVDEGTDGVILLRTSSVKLFLKSNNKNSLLYNINWEQRETQWESFEGELP